MADTTEQLIRRVPQQVQWSTSESEAISEAVSKALSQELSKRRQLTLSQEERSTILKGRYESLQIENDFKPGDLVRWKSGLKNRKLPEENEAAIVIEVLAQPILDIEKDPGSTYYREPLSIVLGVLDPDGDFLTFHFDKRRFEHLPQ